MTLSVLQGKFLLQLLFLLDESAEAKFYNIRKNVCNEINDLQF